jgi:hypothetical protein
MLALFAAPAALAETHVAIEGSTLSIVSDPGASSELVTRAPVHCEACVAPLVTDVISPRPDLTASPPCDVTTNSDGTTYVSCPYNAATSLWADLGDGDDQITAEAGMLGGVTYLAGEGDDQFYGAATVLDLGPGDDHVSERSSVRSLLAGDGDDVIDISGKGFGPSFGITKADGGPGDDTLIGRSVLGGDGDDDLSGTALSGGEGKDTLTAAAAPRARRGARLHGNEGNDVLTGLSSPKLRDQLYGESGRDSLFGLNGPDRLSGGGSRDFCDGGPPGDHNRRRSDRAKSCERAKNVFAP